jgi:hypothetical protein
VLVKINESLPDKVLTQIAEFNGSFEYFPKIALICFAFETPDIKISVTFAFNSNQPKSREPFLSSTYFLIV